MIRLATILILASLFAIVAVMAAAAALLGHYGWEWPVIGVGTVAAFLLYRIGKEVGDISQPTPEAVIEEDTAKFPEQW